MMAREKSAKPAAAGTAGLEAAAPKRWRLRTKLLACAALAILAVGLALFFVPKKQYALLLTEKFVNQARAAGLNVVVTEPELTVNGIRASQLSVFVPRMFSTFNFSDLKVEISPLALLTGSFKASARAQIFGGSISGAVERGFRGGSLLAQLSVSGVHLESAPQFQAFGVESGTVDFALSDVALDDRSGLTGGSWSLAIDNLTKAQDTFMQLPPKTGGGFLAIPAVQKLKLSAGGKLTPAEFTIDSFKTDSSLGSGNLRGSVGTTGILPVSISGDAILSAESQQKFGPFLPVASNNRVPATAKELILHITGSMRRPQLLLETP